VYALSEDVVLLSEPTEWIERAGVRFALPKSCQCGATKQFCPDELDGPQKGDSACQPGDGITHYYDGRACEPGDKLNEKIAALRERDEAMVRPT
jgi:hypothetical protein